jgi:peptide subunit release factor 1 (eRF1)
VETHLRRVATALEEMHARMPFKRIVVAASAQTAPAFIDQLEPELRPLVAGTFGAEMFATDSQLLESAVEVANGAERLEEVVLVNDIVERSLAGGKAMTGWQATLRALSQGRVHRLAIRESLVGSKEADDALTLAWRSGVSVEFVQGEADATLAEWEGLGALLRY